MRTPVKIIEKRGGFLRHDRYIQVEVEGRRYWITVVAAKRVRIPFKPAGTYGWQYRLVVRDENGKSLVAGQCDRSIGVRRALEYAGVLP